MCMQLIELLQQVLETKRLPRRLERQIQEALRFGELNEAEMTLLDQLIDALASGAIQCIA